jgi:hypothetical protein
MRSLVISALTALSLGLATTSGVYAAPINATSIGKSARGGAPLTTVHYRYYHHRHRYYRRYYQPYYYGYGPYYYQPYYYGYRPYYRPYHYSHRPYYYRRGYYPSNSPFFWW